MLAAWQAIAQERPRTAIVAASLLLRVSTALVLAAAERVLPTWDAEVTTLASAHALSARLEAFVRWDTVHYVQIALEGYERDQQTAFLPGLPALLRCGGQLVRRFGTGEWGGFTANDAVIAGIVATAIATTAAALALHRLTLQVFPKRLDLASMAALLFLLAPSRPTLHGVPYTEPFAAFFTFLGMLLFLRDRDWSAALVWAVGSAFRAQGILLGFGFFGWKWILRKTWFDGPGSAGRHTGRLLVNAPVFAALALLSASPFFAFEAYVYRRFCHSPDTARPWCTQGLGMSYGWVQREYWNSGFLRYWIPLQIPNFLLAAPVLVMSFAASYSFFTANPDATWRSALPFLAPPRWVKRQSESKSVDPSGPSAPATSPSRAGFLHRASPARAEHLVPFVILSTSTTLLLFFAHHVQIILRVCATDPVLFWFAAELVLRDENLTEGEQRGEAATKANAIGAAVEQAKATGGGATKSPQRWKWGRIWWKYCLVWGTLSIVLWAVFLPPA
ncbi:hypothetical protein JCM8202_001024 [Rhodotorula sphaerocarpa]